MEENKLEEATSGYMEIEETVKSQLEKVRMTGLLSGAKAICGIILEDIAEFKNEPGKKTFRQQERLIKRIQDFCQVSLSRTINENGEIVPIDKETVEQKEN